MFGFIGFAKGRGVASWIRHIKADGAEGQAATLLINL